MLIGFLEEDHVMTTTLACPKIRRAVRCTLAAVVPPGFFAPRQSDRVSTDRFVGTVTDSSGLAAPGATVTITHAEIYHVVKPTDQRHGHI